MVAHPKMMSGQIEKKTCVLIVRKMNKMWKYIVNVLDGEFSPWPRWLWVFNIACIVMGISIIIFV